MALHWLSRMKPRLDGRSDRLLDGVWGRVLTQSEPQVEQMLQSLADWRTSSSLGCELAERLDPSRDHIVGNPAARIAVVEYDCYGSSSDARDDRAFRAELRGVLEQGRVCFARRHFPLIDAHPEAWLAACAVEAADYQGRFWDLHEAMSQALAQTSSRRLEPRLILALARDLGLSVDRLIDDIVRPAIADRIMGEFRGGVRSGVNGTPTFYVAGIRQLVDTPEQLIRRLERALGGDLTALWPPITQPPGRHPA